jgi:hypothetical protein
MMILLNFSHPLTKQHQDQIAEIAGNPVHEIRDIPVQFDNHKPFEEQIRELVDTLDLKADHWQSAPILVNPPSYNFGALTLIAELHGRMGYFPAIVRIRPLPGSTPPAYQVAEIINLQSIRDKARTRRAQG